MQTPTLVEKATWSPQSIAATLWSFPSGPERRTSRLFCAPGPNLLQGEVIKKLIISNEELVIGPEEMTVSSTLRSPKALGDWEAPNCIHMGAGDFLSSRWQGLTAVQETLTIKRTYLCSVHYFNFVNSSWKNVFLQGYICFIHVSSGLLEFFLYWSRSIIPVALTNSPEYCGLTSNW